MTATVTIYLETLRECHLWAVAADELDDAVAAIDARLGDYIEYLRAELAEEGITLETEPGQAVYSELVEADTAAEEDAARFAMSRVSDFWEWYS